MPKLLLRILFSVLFALFVFFLFSAYQYYRALHSDDPVVPSVLVELGTVTIVRWELAIDMVRGESYDLQQKDTIITKQNALAIVTWPDRSQTRLGSNSRMQIDRMVVARDYSSIEIEFALEQGQVWSTVVRTMYPGSYFRTRIPNQGVIAGVRWTIYDIDLTRGYIRSIDHSVMLTDTRGNTVSLLPGELTSVTNILKKLGKEAIDQTWNTMNRTRDTIFLEAHSTALQVHFDKISGKTWGFWDRCVRWILSFVPTFSDLAILEWLLSDVPGFEDVKIPKEKVLGFYQKFQDTKFVQQREKIRVYIDEQSESLGLDKGYLETFSRGAIYDQLSFSGLTLKSAESMVSDYVDGLDAQIQNVMQIVPTKELDTKARETLRQLLK